MRCNPILDRLWVGSFPACPEDVRTLREAGITAVLNLQTDEDIRWNHEDRAAVEAELKKAGIAEVREPVRDFDIDDLADRLPEVVMRLDELIEAGHTVYVHCTAGMNRSPTAVIAYLHWVRGLDLEQAVRLVYGRHACDPFTDAIQSQPRPAALPLRGQDRPAQG
ncbi:MAG: dual specificity protein phosphatase family protein [Thermogutta sp.]